MSSPDPISLILAAPQVATTDEWFKAFADDPRVRVVAIANSAADLQAKLQAMQPEALLVDAKVFASPRDLTQQLTRFAGAAWVVLPAQATPAETQTVRQVPCIKYASPGECEVNVVSSALVEAVATLRATAQVAPAATPIANSVAPPLNGPPPTGLRVIAVWNLAGGVGKTTIATCLAFAASQKHLKTLLVGLGAPDDMGILLPRIKAQPNLSQWHANPTPEGLRACVQNAEGLDVLPGYADVQSAVSAPVDPQAPGGLSQLVMTAALAGYSVIVLDAPSTERAALALAVANQVLLVARPTNSDALRSVEAYRTVTERLEGQHRVPRAGLRVVLNQVRNGLHSAKEFHEACAALLGPQQAFPPIVATLPDDPRVPAAQNTRQIPLAATPDFARAFAPIAEACLQITPAVPVVAAPPKPKFQLGPLTIG